MIRSPLRISCSCAAVLFLSACGGTGGTGSAAPAPPAAASTAQLEALYHARQAEALDRVSEADVEFLTGMIFHHAQALVMSAWAPTNGASASIRTLASRIINAQKDEIHNMQVWLRDRSRPVPEVDDSGATRMPGAEGHAMHGMDHGMDHGMIMPGMLSPEQMRELEGASGPDFDRLFLTYMIQHHQGAVGMVHELFAKDGAAQDELIFKLASDIQVDQITEINRMQLMLDALPGAERFD